MHKNIVRLMHSCGNDYPLPPGCVVGRMLTLGPGLAQTHLAFSPQFTTAVESKQVAQQDAERSKWIVEKANEEKKSIIIAAQGEAEAAKLISNAIKNNPGFIEMREIQYARDVADTLATSTNQVYMSSDALLISGIARALGRDEHQAKKKGWIWN